MNFKFLITLSLVTLLTLSFFTAPLIQSNQNAKSKEFTAPIMCAELEGRCTGSAYCTACKNCSRCGYCNSGGSCGVCGKRAQTYPTKKKKKRTVNKNYNNINLPSSSSYQSNYLTEDIYVLTHKTSLRQSATSQSVVLKRLAINDIIQMLDGVSNKYWCKVIFKGEIGWIKKHLLQKQKVGIRP